MKDHDETSAEVSTEAKETTEETTQAIDPRDEEIASLREQVEGQARRIDELTRAYADLLNERESFRRRMERESERQLETAKGDIAAVLLDAAEDLRRATESQTADAQALAEGVRLITDNFFRQLGQMGLERIEAVGRPFDPLVHEAVDLVPTEDEAEDGKVIEEARAGWKMGERVLRASRVRVARLVPRAQGPDSA